ncbi:MAG: hypothetical protein NTU53_24680, partial [Planctomycetota bacterium]|nr:hypothetical protein [Planctomycetota bacterium]
QTLTSADGKNWVLGNLAPLTNIAGDYTLQLLANGSGIVGATPARTLAADAIDAFRVTATNLTGTANADQYYIRANGDNLEIFTTLPPGATPTYSSPLDMLTGLSVNSGAGNDVLHIAGTLPLSPAINGGPGSDKLILDSGTHSFFNELAGPWSIEQLDVRSSAAIRFNASQVLEQLSISGDGSVQLAPSASRSLTVNQLSIADNGVLNIHDNGVIVGGMTLADVSALVRSGSGITSALATNGSYKGIAVISNDVGDGTPRKATFYETAVGASDILVQCVWNGDTNLDGLVNADDYFQVDSGFVTQKKGYANGDFNYDDVVNADDYFLIDSSFVGQSGSLASQTPEALPADVVMIRRSSKNTSADSILSQLFSTKPLM